MDVSLTATAITSSTRIFGTGEMADLIRAFDWSTTPVGPIEQWPETLLITVNTMLATRHPMFLWWGPDLIQFYNDGYRPTIRSDKHPKALGQPGRELLARDLAHHRIADRRRNDARRVHLA